MAKTKAVEGEEQPQAIPAPSPPRTERYEKQEKGEKHEKHEKREKQEKQEKKASEKSEKHEKRGLSIWGSMLTGTLLVALGVIVFLANSYGVPRWLLWPIFLIIVGIAVIIYVIIATMAIRRSPPPA